MRFCCHSGKSVGWKNNKHCHLHKNMTLYMFDWCRCVVQNSTLQSHCIKNGQKKWLRKVMMLSERRTKQDRKRKKLRKQDRKWERKGESETNENAERSRTRGETTKNNYVDNLTWSQLDASDSWMTLQGTLGAAGTSSKLGWELAAHLSSMLI